jgi:hypothetical protein
MIDCVLSYSLTYARKRIELGNEHWYECVKKLVESSHEGEVAILWKQPVQTDWPITNNQPDIIIHSNEKVTCMLICVAMSGDKCDQERSQKGSKL